jgi:hypothetical protein
LVKLERTSCKRGGGGGGRIAAPDRRQQATSGGCPMHAQKGKDYGQTASVDKEQQVLLGEGANRLTSFG